MKALSIGSDNRYRRDFGHTERILARGRSALGGKDLPTVAASDASVNRPLQIRILSEQPFHATGFCAEHQIALGFFTHHQLSRGVCPRCAQQNVAA